jgi:8-oxo-dGTP diphosphatase
MASHESDPTAGIPVFGTRMAGCAYVRRPSAYALVRNSRGEWAAVRTPNGCFLPGGGKEAGETPENTVQREAREECGFVLSPRGLVARAIQFVYSTEEKKYFEKICEFVEAELVGSEDPLEPDHELIWLSLDQAQASLSHESHRWAVGLLRKQKIEISK